MIPEHVNIPLASVKGQQETDDEGFEDLEPTSKA